MPAYIYEGQLCGDIGFKASLQPRFLACSDVRYELLHFVTPEIMPVTHLLKVDDSRELAPIAVTAKRPLVSFLEA